jgi:hypothetical protein
VTACYLLSPWPLVVWVSGQARVHSRVSTYPHAVPWGAQRPDPKTRSLKNLCCPAILLINDCPLPLRNLVSQMGQETCVSSNKKKILIFKCL